MSFSMFFYTQKLALTSPTTGGRTVGIVRMRTKATEFVFVCLKWYEYRILFILLCGVKLLKMQRVTSFSMKLKLVKWVQEHWIESVPNGAAATHLTFPACPEASNLTVEMLVQEDSYRESRPVWILLSSFPEIQWFTWVFSWDLKRALKVRFSFLCLTDEQHSRRLNASEIIRLLSVPLFFLLTPFCAHKYDGCLSGFTPKDAHKNSSFWTPRLVIQFYTVPR
jgi:hypothetical protein